MYNSIFKNYRVSGPNSFDMNLSSFNHNEPLFAHHVLVSSNANTIVNSSPIFASEKGFFIKNDCIIANLPINNSTEENYYSIKLKLYSLNRYYYFYKEKRNGIQYLIYTKLGFEKLRQYVYETTHVAGDEVFDEDVIGAMTIFHESLFDKKNSACTTILLSKKRLPHKRSFNIEEPDYSPDTLSFSYLKNLRTRGFTLALIHDILKQTDYINFLGENIDFSQLGDWEGFIERNSEELGFEIFSCEKAKAKNAYEDFFYSMRSKDEQSQKFENYLKDNYDSFSDDLKDIIAYLFPKNYKYTALSSDMLCRYRDARLISYVNFMMSTHKRGVTDEMNPFSYTEQDAKEFSMLLDKALNDVLGNKNKLSWLDGDDMLSMSYISGLLLINTDINYNEYQIRSAFSVWAYYMLYKAMLNCSPDEKFLFSTLIYHVLGTNIKTFSKFMDIIKEKTINVIDPTMRVNTSSWSHWKSDVCVGELICFFSNSFKTYYDVLSDDQKQYIGNGCNTNADYLEVFTNYFSRSVSHTYTGLQNERKEYARTLFEYISEMLHRPDYTNKCILDVVD